MKSIPSALVLTFIFLPFLTSAQDSLAVEIEQFFDKMLGEWVLTPEDVEIHEQDPKIMPPEFEFIESTYNISKIELGIGIKISYELKGRYKGKEVVNRNYHTFYCACYTSTKSIVGYGGNGSYLAEIQGNFESGRLHTQTSAFGFTSSGTVFSTFIFSDEGSTLISKQKLILPDGTGYDMTERYKRSK